MLFPFCSFYHIFLTAAPRGSITAQPDVIATRPLSTPLLACSNFRESFDVLASKPSHSEAKSKVEMQPPAAATVVDTITCHVRAMSKK